jgi:outer membrane receptor for ferrienterochelin and colicins
VRLLPGRRVLFVSAAGHQTARIEPEVVPDATTTVDVPLAPAAPPAGAIVVRANVEGALVRVDGAEMGFTPTVVEDVPVGLRLVEVSQEGRRTHRAQVRVQQGQRAYLDVRLGRSDLQVTSATKELAPAEQAPASITVVTADEIAGFGWTTIAEALAGVRGVFASNDRTYESVGFRGFSPPGDYTNRVLVLVDGHPYNDVLSGQGYVGHDFDVDLANVERIEIVRGPGSILYGTGALFGVVNVVTRSATRPLQAEIGGHLGTRGTRSGRLTLGGRRGAVEILASAAALDQIGDRRFPVDEAATTIAARADLERAWHADLLARVGSLSLRAGANERTKTVPTGVFETRPEPGTTYRDKRLFAELRAQQPLGRARASARAAYDASRFLGHYVLRPDTLGAPRDALSDRLSADWLTGELRLALPALARHNVTVGAEAQRQLRVELGDPAALAQRRAGARRELVLSGYAVDDWQIAPWLRLDLGLRADRHGRSFGSTLNPRAALVARPYAGGNTKIFAGRAFRAPSPYERFYNDGGVTQRAAEDLAPELILSADVEHAHAVDEDVLLIGTAFASEVANLIVLEGAPGEALVYRNHPHKIRSLGGGGELRWEPGDGARLVLAYGFQRVRSLADGGARPFPNAPSHAASLRALSPLGRGKLRLGNELLLDVGRRTRDAERVEDAVIWNVVLSGEHRPWRLRYYGGIWNLLDVRGHGPGFPVGDEVPAATVPRYGRMVRVGLAFSL